jgi:FdhE protein
MRQGEVAPKAAWQGNPSGGVKAPKPILLPAPATLFAHRAARLIALAGGHPMEPWLRFMADLSRAQALASSEPPAPPEAGTIAQAVAAGLPPLAAAGHRRSPLWREALRKLLAEFDHGYSPPEARETAHRVANSPDIELEAFADDVLNGRAGDPGASLYVAAALQVYFAALAASLPVDALRLLPERGLCPACGSTPVGGVITASGDSPGVRYLHCSLCCTAWNHTRAVCITCGGSRSLTLKSVEGDAGIAKAEACDECRTYAKIFYAAKDPDAEPVADDLATLGLDLLMAEEGWSRHAPSLLLRL